MTAQGLWLFVDDERPAPEGWGLLLTAEYAIESLNACREGGVTVDRLSLDHDLGYTADTVMPVLYWMRDTGFWPRELYVHTANEDAEEVMLGFIREHAPAGTLRGWGCNYWGTGPDSVEQHHPDDVVNAELSAIIARADQVTPEQRLRFPDLGKMREYFAHRAETRYRQ